MRIDQRSCGSSYAIVNSSGYGSCDRWGSLAAATGVWSQQRVTTGSTDFPFETKVQRTAGSTSTARGYIGQVIETSNCQDLAGQSVAVSFYATAGANFSATGSIVLLEVYTGTGSDQGWTNLNTVAWTGQTQIASSSQAITTIKTRYSLTALIPSGVNEIGIRFSAVGTGTAGANDWFQITGVQLEQGSTATDFERRPIGTETMLCQRYYDKSYSIDVAPNTVTKAGLLLFSTETYVGAWYPGGASIRFSAEMRRVPDFTYIDSDGTTSRVNAFYNGGTAAGANPPFTFYVSKKSVAISQTGINVGGSAGSPLLAHYTANAEL
jgi:hypothetical protein